MVCFRMDIRTLVVCLIAMLSNIEAYRILLLPVHTQSHYVYFSRLGEELVKHGHHVTLVAGERHKLPSNVQACTRFNNFY